jgi:protein gp37
MEHTGIAWTDHTFNIAWGCFKVSPGCAHCYADTLSKRFGHDVWGPPATTPRKTMSASYWKQPLKWNANAEREGVRRRVFCSSMCDVFEDHPTITQEREKLWPLIRATPWLDWQLLTKRPERIAENLPADWWWTNENKLRGGYPNVWLGTSIESQQYVSRLDDLLSVPAKVHFVSVEPLLGDVAFGVRRNEPPEERWTGFTNWPEWVIVGGESGAGHREMPMGAFTAIVDEAKRGGSAVFVKQDSGPKPGQQGRIPGAYWLKEMPS